MDPLDHLTKALDAAQNELKSAEIEYLDAQVRVSEARMAEERLKAAVAALNGEFSAPASALRADAEPQSPEFPETGGESAEGRQSGSRPDPAPNPYGHVKCTGCGQTGGMLPGRHNMLVCQACGNMVG